MNLMTRREVADMFGRTVETISKYTTRKVNPIPHFKLGNEFRYPEDKVNKWIEKQLALEIDEKLFDVNSIKE